MTSPTAGATVGGTVTVTATASDDVGVTSVQFLLDGAALGAAGAPAPYEVAWPTTIATNGAHTLDRGGARCGRPRDDGDTVSVTVLNDTTAPTVAVTSPAAGTTVGGTVTVTATASDDVGVTSVQFLLDGAALGAADTDGAVRGGWATPTATNGAHTLTAVARDAAGHEATRARSA